VLSLPQYVTLMLKFWTTYVAVKKVSIWFLFTTSLIESFFLSGMQKVWAEIVKCKGVSRERKSWIGWRRPLDEKNKGRFWIGKNVEKCNRLVTTVMSFISFLINIINEPNNLNCLFGYRDWLVRYYLLIIISNKIIQSFMMTNRVCSIVHYSRFILSNKYHCQSTINLYF